VDSSWSSRSRSLSESSVVSEPDQITLNVGGRLFCTSKATLTNAGGKDSFFVSMLSGRFPVVRDKHERIFIDRDATHFRHIINFLRDGGVGWDPTEMDLNTRQIRQLLREVKYYNIVPLQRILEKYLIRLHKEQQVKKFHVVIVDGYRYYVSLAVELFLSNGFMVDGYTGTASSNSKWVSVLLRGDRRKLMANIQAVTKLRELLVSGHLVTEFFAQNDDKEGKKKAAAAAARAAAGARGDWERDISISGLSQLTLGENEDAPEEIGEGADHGENEEAAEDD